MCDEKTTRRIRIVKFDRAIPFIQLLVLAAGLILLAIALSDNETGTIFLVLAFLAILVSICWRVRLLYREGLTFELQEVDDDDPTRLTLVAEEVSQDDEEIISAQATSVEADEESAGDKSDKEEHWTNQEYPDPDVELGLKKTQPGNTTPEEEENVIR